MPISPLTADEFKLALPDKVKKNVNQNLVDRINQIIESPETLEVFKDNLLSYTHVIQEGRFKVESYINSVLFVSFKLHGSTDKDAYIKTFPEKYKRFLADKVADKDIASYISAYKKSKLVTLVFGQTLTPFHIVNADARQRALNIQVTLMTDGDVSPKVRCEAANSVLTHLKPPDEGKLELQVPDTRDDTIERYQQVMLELVQTQQKLIAEGGNVVDIANASIKSGIKPADAVEVVNDIKKTNSPVTLVQDITQDELEEERLFK